MKLTARVQFPFGTGLIIASCPGTLETVYISERARCSDQTPTVRSGSHVWLSREGYRLVCHYWSLWPVIIDPYGTVPHYVIVMWSDVTLYIIVISSVIRLYTIVMIMSSDIRLFLTSWDQNVFRSVFLRVELFRAVTIFSLDPWMFSVALTAIRRVFSRMW